MTQKLEMAAEILAIRPAWLFCNNCNDLCAKNAFFAKNCWPYWLLSKNACFLHASLEITPCHQINFLAFQKIGFLKRFTQMTQNPEKAA